MTLDFHATAAERQEADTLAKADVITNGHLIHDLSVSCYTATGENGRPEDVHEQRLSDGSCRCGYNKARNQVDAYMQAVLDREHAEELIHNDIF